MHIATLRLYYLCLIAVLLSLVAKSQDVLLYAPSFGQCINTKDVLSATVFNNTKDSVHLNITIKNNQGEDILSALSLGNNILHFTLSAEQFQLSGDTNSHFLPPGNYFISYVVIKNGNDTLSKVVKQVSSVLRKPSLVLTDSTISVTDACSPSPMIHHLSFKQGSGPFSKPIRLKSGEVYPLTTFLWVGHDAFIVQDVVSYNDSIVQVFYDTIPANYNTPAQSSSKPLYKKISPKGNVSIEYFLSNNTYGTQILKPSYFRFYCNPSLEILGLPLQLNTTLTNDDLYPISWGQFSAGIDHQAFMEKIMRDSIYTYQSGKLDMDLARNDLVKLDREINIEEHKLARMKDTSTVVGYRKNTDREKERILKKEHNIQQLKEKKRILERGIKRDSLLTLNDPGQGEMRLSHKKSYEWKSFVSKIRKLEVGNVNPHFTDLTLKSIPILGINSTYESNKILISVASGKTLNTRFNSSLLFNDRSNTYLGNSYSNGIRAGLKGKHHQIYINLVSFIQDKKAINPTKDNLVLSVENKFLIGNIFTAGLEVSKSYLRFQGNTQEDGLAFSSSDLLNIRKENYALEGSLQMQISASTEARIKYTRLGPNYYAYGVPFLRNDFRQIEAGVKKYLLKRKIMIDLFARQNRDNLSDQKYYTLTLMSYGFSARSFFRKYPNFYIRYNPNSYTSEMPSRSFNTQQDLKGYCNVFLLSVDYNKILSEKKSLSFTSGYIQQSNITETQTIVSSNAYLSVAYLFPARKKLSIYYSNIRYNQHEEPNNLFSASFITPVTNKISCTNTVSYQFAGNRNFIFGYTSALTYQVLQNLSFTLTGNKKLFSKNFDVSSYDEQSVSVMLTFYW